MLAASNSNVEILWVVDDFSLGFSLSCVNPLLDVFALQAAE
jgi:hypothetical protein